MRVSRCVSALAFGLTAALSLGWATTPTWRPQLKLFPAGQVAQMGESAFAPMQKSEPVARVSPTSCPIDCVARALALVVSPPEGGPQWEVTVLEGNQVNAFAMTGDNIGIYKGLLELRAHRRSGLP